MTLVDATCIYTTTSHITMDDELDEGDIENLESEDADDDLDF